MRNLLYITLALLLSVPMLAQSEEVTTTPATEEVEATEETAEAKRDARTAYNEAVEQMRVKNYLGAFPLFEESIQLGSENASDSTTMKTLRLANKNGAKAAYGYALSLRKEKKYDEMLRVAQAGIQMDDDYYANYISLGQALDKTGKTKESVDAYFKAAQLSEAAERSADKIASLYRNGFLKLYKAKNFDGIIKSVEAYPNALKVADINYYTAKAQEAKKNSAKAIEYAEKAGELGSGKKVGKYFSYLGDLYRKATKVDKAIAAYKKVPEGSRYHSQAQYNIEKLSN